MRRTEWIVLAGLALSWFPGLSADPVGSEAPGEIIAPAFRDARHFETGRRYIENLPEGTTIEIRRADGTRFELALADGRLTTSLPPVSVSEDGTTLTLPGGYSIRYKARPPQAVVFTAPSGATTRFSWRMNTGMVEEADGGIWSSKRDPLILRVTDGTRVDAMDRMHVWEVMTLAGERFRMELPEGRWLQLPDLPSPPLVPTLKSYYVAGDGDDWRRPAIEDHLVFAWNWITVGLPIEQVIEDVSIEPRRTDLRVYFNKLDRPQAPWDMAACILGRRLALGGGDMVVFHVPEQDPRTAFLLPGPLEPDYIPLSGVPYKTILSAPRRR